MAAALFGHFVPVGTTPGAAGADWEESYRIFQTEGVGLQEEWRNQVVSLQYVLL